MANLKISDSDARGIGFAFTQLIVAKTHLNAGNLDHVNAALFAMSQMLELVLYRLEHQDPSLKTITGGIVAPEGDGRYFV